MTHDEKYDTGALTLHSLIAWATTVKEMDGTDTRFFEQMIHTVEHFKTDLENQRELTRG